MAPVHGRALRRLEGPTGEGTHRDGRPGRARRRQADLRLRGAGVVGHLADRRQLAHPPLAGAHGHRRVALQQLERVEALVDRVVDVLAGDVLAEAGEALVAAAACSGRRQRARARRRSPRRARAPRAPRLAAPARPRRRSRARAPPRRPRPRPRSPPARRRSARRPRRPRAIPAGGSSGMWAPLSGSQCALVPAWSSSEDAGTVPPETAIRSQLNPRSVSGTTRPSPSSSAITAAFTSPRPTARATVRPRRWGIPASLSPAESGSSAPPGRESATATISTPAACRESAEARPRSRSRGDHGGAPRAHPVEAGETLGAGAEHHPGQVVSLEHQRLLDRARGGDVALGANLMKRAAAPDRDDPVEEAERSRRRKDLDLRLGEALAQPPGGGGAGTGEQAAAQLGAVIDQDDVGAQLCSPQRRRHPGDAAADHQQVGVAAAVLGPPFALGLAPAQPAEAGGVPQDLLVEGPEPAWPDEGLVVEAGRGEPAAEDVGGAHRVEAQRGAGVHVRDLHPLAGRLGAGPDTGRAVDLDQAVGALAGAAEQPPGAVVLEAARDDLLTGSVESGADRVALERADRAPVEAELDLAPAVDPLSRLRRQPAHRSSPPGRPTQLTSLVVVSRSARNQARHPER